MNISKRKLLARFRKFYRLNLKAQTLIMEAEVVLEALAEDIADDEFFMRHDTKRRRKKKGPRLVRR